MCIFCKTAMEGNLIFLAEHNESAGRLNIGLDVFLHSNDIGLPVIGATSIIGDVDAIELDVAINYCPMCGKAITKSEEKQWED